MRGLLRWILFAIAVIVIILILVNVANKSKKVKPKTNEPTVYERSTRSEDTQEGLEPIETTTDITSGQSVELADTASFSTVCVFIGTFVLSFGLYYIKKKQLN